MNYATIGFWFIFCLLIGVGIGSIFSMMEFGGTIGLGVGLLLILLFRERDKKI